MVADKKWSMDSNIPWDNKEFFLLLVETKVPVVIPTQGRGVFVGTVVSVCDTHIWIMSIEKCAKDPIEIYLSEIDEHIYVTEKLTRYNKYEGEGDNG